MVTGFSFGLERLLKMHNAELESRKRFAGADKDKYTAGSKFQVDVPENSQGNFEDFHKGLAARIGDIFK